MKFTLVILAAVALVAPAYGTVYNRCSLARAMHSMGVPKDQLARWTCIAQHESSYNTKAVGTMNSNGSRDYGLFQINNKYWCLAENGTGYNQCHIKCRDLLVDSIAPSVKCAQQVLRQQGWTAWSTWKYCSGSLPSIDSCF